MIRPDQIPDEVVEAARVAIFNGLHNAELTSRGLYEAIAEAVCLAMINAWPGMEKAILMSNDDWTTLPGPRSDGIILPLTEGAGQ